MYKSAIAFGLLLFIVSCCGEFQFGNRKVEYFRERLSWYDADSKCQEEGMQLLTLRDNDEYNRIKEIATGIGANLYWTGGNDKDNGVFKWGLAGKRFMYTRWWPGFPERRGKLSHCVDVFHNVRHIGIRVDACHKLKTFFCETEGIINDED